MSSSAATAAAQAQLGVGATGADVTDWFQQQLLAALADPLRNLPKAFLTYMVDYVATSGLNIPIGQVIGGSSSGVEFAYKEVATDTTTASATPVDLVTFDVTTFDAVRHYFNLMVPILRHSASNASVAFLLYDVTAAAAVGSTIQVDCSPTAGQGVAANVVFPFTPAAPGSRQYKVMWEVITAGTATIRTTSLAPASFRIYRS